MYIENIRFSEALRAYVEQDKVLYNHQGDVVYCAAKDLVKGYDGGVIQAPTGIGKTVIMGGMMDAFISEFNSERGLVLVPRNLLADQTQESFVGITSIKSNKIGIYNSDVDYHNKKNALERQILITTPASYMNLSRSGVIHPRDFGYTCIDEAHKAKGPQTRIAVGGLIEHSKVHCFTATDQFADGTSVGGILFNRKDYIYELSFKQAVRKGFICEVRNVVFKTGIDASDIGDPNRELTSNEQRKLAMRIGRDEIAIDKSVNFVDSETGISFKDKLSIWYCTGIDHAHQVAEKLNKAHNDPNYAVAVSGRTPYKELYGNKATGDIGILERHKRGEIKAVVNADLLIEGWDNKKASICYILRDVMSPNLIMQMGGRIGRNDPSNPDKLGYVVNLKDIGRNALMFYEVAGGNFLIKENSKWGVGHGLGGCKRLIDINSSVDTSNVIITSQDFIDYEAERIHELEALGLQKKTENWLTKNEFANFINVGTANENYNKLWDIVKETGKIDEIEIKCGIKRSFTRATFCVHDSEADKFRNKLGIKDYSNLEDKTEDWFAKVECAQMLGVSHETALFAGLWNEAEEKGTIDSVAIECGYKRAAAMKPFCIHRSALEILNEKLGRNLDEKTKEWNIKFDAASKLETTVLNLTFTALWQEAEEKGTVGGVKIECGKKLSGMKSKIVFCVHESSFPIFKEKMGRNVEEKTEDWCGKVEFSKLLGTKYTNKVFCKLWDEAEQSGTVKGEKIQLKIMKSGGSNFINCIHKNAKSIFEKYLDKNVGEKTADWYTKRDVATAIKINVNDKFETLWKEAEEKGTVGGTKMEGSKKRSGNKIVFCVHKDAISIFKDKYGKNVEEKSADWLTKKEFCKKVRTYKEHPTFLSLWKEIEEKGTVGGHKVECGNKKTGLLISFFVHESAVGIFREVFNKSKGAAKEDKKLLVEAESALSQITPPKGVDANKRKK